MTDTNTTTATASPPAGALPPPALMMQMIHWKHVSRCVSLVAELGLADMLADGPRNADDLAADLGMDSDGLYRVMRMLASAEVFEELPDRRFQNNTLSETLRSNVPGSMRDYARWIGTDFHWRLASDLDYSVQTRKPAVLKHHGDTSPFEILAKDPHAQQRFNEAMTGVSAADAMAIVHSYDFTRFQRIIDVGGGHGMLAISIARSAPQATVRVLDLPHVTEGTAQHIKSEGLDDRMDAIGGSFFDGVPGPVDLCVLKHTIHDWDDEQSARILANCRDALDDDGRVLLCEMMITDGPEALSTRLLDIEMLVGPGGKERTRDEFAQLFQSAGLELTQVIETPTPMRLIEAVKA